MKDVLFYLLVITVIIFPMIFSLITSFVFIISFIQNNFTWLITNNVSRASLFLGFVEWLFVIVFIISVKEENIVNE